ncbi:methyltransferase domain-containing protein [Dinoroseobacter sp. PD6]|uniref:class I SAM-dependent DNA methyltransferase n=1 Tax=Dinoroseobacter sp. PD6 TaxID=3028384 RepID=UPI00237B06E5|nr:class I SAM-dependent methyltransferase [Dinoroseobacter sp. PD6]MDD9716012.1 methyltransferase domain-containing protein [Dinoroseobacter sp. PD6]
MTPPPPPTPEQVLSTYGRVADDFARMRNTSLFELPMLQAVQAHAPGRDLLDLGCGPGAPLARWLSWRGFRVTGVDGAAGMLPHFRRSTRGARTLRADMRHLALGRRFDALLAWDSFFHLSLRDQARMFPVFARHARRGAVLVFSSGPARGVAFGRAAGAPIFHASHAPLAYRRMLRQAGFTVLRFSPEDPALDRHSWWLCRRLSRAH